ncbi:hypothetical protein [Acinetobacter sp. NIPH 817]|uniref:hypothetical protein n=1 Tax=Acinetobacter sp. NIPH 817 TaxID=520708 RepID=UPI0002D028F6|nr:hypothetical protein [Acinetobacter sp. NIPH 817]ENV03485.1 hypothetical protein F968_01139 [Acinetobacter sp. NIPH 817]
MDLLEWIKTLISGVSTILIPILIWRLNRNSTENSKLKLHSDIDLDIEAAKDFEKLKNDSSLSRLTKDRFSKKLFNNSAINFDEASYFTQYRDADKLVNIYVLYKDRIKLIYDSNNLVSSLEPKAPKKQRIYFFLSYILFVSLAVTPYIFFGEYKAYILNYYHAQNYTVTMELILGPLLCFIVGIMCLNEGGKQSSVIRFIDNLKKEETKVDATDMDEELLN